MAGKILNFIDRGFDHFFLPLIIPACVVLFVLILLQSFGLILMRDVSGLVISKEVVLEPAGWASTRESHFLIVDDDEGVESVRVSLGLFVTTQEGDHVSFEVPR